MPYIAYVDKNFGIASARIIDHANEIVDEYERDGFTLTLRQVYYQFVARGLMQNKFQEYKRLGSILNDARLAGLMDWNAMEDRTRWLRSNDYDSGNPDTWLQRALNSFSKKFWATQPYSVEVWVEKDALVGIVESACTPLYVPYFACRGYTSQSELWTASQRVLDKMRDEKEVIILHLGDHDPSGIDMTRDIEDRLDLFCQHEGYDAPEIRRLALNMDQVRTWNPPPNPTKLTDTRAAEYIGKYGRESWELDALNPRTLSDLITDNITPLIDMEAWAKVQQEQDEGKGKLRLVADNWDRVSNWLLENPA